MGFFHSVTYTTAGVSLILTSLLKLTESIHKGPVLILKGHGSEGWGVAAVLAAGLFYKVLHELGRKEPKHHSHAPHFGGVIAHPAGIEHLGKVIAHMGGAEHHGVMDHAGSTDHLKHMVHAGSMLPMTGFGHPAHMDDLGGHPFW